MASNSSSVPMTPFRISPELQCRRETSRWIRPRSRSSRCREPETRHVCSARYGMTPGCAERLKLLYESERAGIPLITLHNCSGESKLTLGVSDGPRSGLLVSGAIRLGHRLAHSTAGFTVG